MTSTKGSTAPFELPWLLWFTVFAVTGVAASLIADTLFSEAVIVAAFAACLALIAALRLFRRSVLQQESKPLSRELALGAARGFGLGAIFLLSAMVCWFAGEVASGGRMPKAQLWAGRIVLAEFLGVILFFLLRRTPNRVWEIIRRIVLTIVLASLAVAAVLYYMLTGPADLARYPAAASSPYWLPWPSGLTRLCCQSNRGIVSHRGAEEYAYDFAMPVGSVFCASRPGTVVLVIDEHDGNGPNAPNNEIRLLHDDGSIGRYLHLRHGGSLVRSGQKVARGQALGCSGNVGLSLLPHLHFHVENLNGTIPISFAEVAGNGVPRMFRRYTSGNELKE